MPLLPRLSINPTRVVGNDNTSGTEQLLAVAFFHSEQWTDMATALHARPLMSAFWACSLESAHHVNAPDFIWDLVFRAFFIYFPGL
jgi:hypothetical protein